MAKDIYVKEEVEIPENVEIEVVDKKVKIRGPLGELEKDFSHIPKLLLNKVDRKIVIEVYLANKRERAVVKTVASHITNMIIGVQKGYRYKMKIVYAHFPMSLKVEENKVIIQNFLGERGYRIAKIVPGAKVKVEKDDVIIEGIDKEAVSQTAANIHLATRLTGKRKMSPHGREGGGPGILDGVYLYAIEYMKE